MQQRRTLVLTAVIALVTVAVAWLVILRPLAPDPVSASPGSGTAAAPTGSASAGTPSTPSTPAARATLGTKSLGATGTTSPEAAGTTSTTSTTKQPATTGASPQATAASRRCVAGVPARLVIPALGVNASFQSIGVDASAPSDAQGRKPLGNPSDRTQAGWYSAGPRPGSGTGTVIANGHTYHDGSAIFKESFASTVATGQRIDVVQVNGTVCSYQVQQVWRDVSKSDYPTIVSSQGLYDFSGPERLFLATCGGPFDPSGQNYDHISMLIATPINRG